MHTKFRTNPSLTREENHNCKSMRAKEPYLAKGDCRGSIFFSKTFLNVPHPAVTLFHLRFPIHLLLGTPSETRILLRSLFTPPMIDQEKLSDEPFFLLLASAPGREPSNGR